MTDCIVTSISMGGTGAEDRFTESVTLNFAAVKTEYFQANSLGIDVPAGLFSWDIAANSWIDTGDGGGGRGFRKHSGIPGLRRRSGDGQTFLAERGRKNL